MPRVVERKEAVVQVATSLLSAKASVLERNIFDNSSSDSALSAARYNCKFLIPTLCDLMGVMAEDIEPSTASPPTYYYYPAAQALSIYGEKALSRLMDVYVSPHGMGQQKDEVRRKNAFDLLFDVRHINNPVQNVVFMRQQADHYRTYANRMKILAERVQDGTTPTFPAPTLDTRPAEQRLRRACEILVALEGGNDKPLTPATEAALVQELGMLRQDFSAPALVEYLAKPVAGIDKAQVKGALLTIGEPAIPEVLRFLRADGRSQEELEEGLSLLIALCHGPEAAKARLLKTAQTDEDGAKLFDAQAARLQALR